MDGVFSVLAWVVGVALALVGLAFAGLAAWAYCGFKPKPSPGVLKDGTKISQLQQYETDFLYKEIFEEACYRTGADFRAPPAVH